MTGNILNTNITASVVIPDYNIAEYIDRMIRWRFWMVTMNGYRKLRKKMEHLQRHPILMIVEIITGKQ